MTDQPLEQPTTGATDKPIEQPANGKTDIASLPPDIQAYIKSLRDEAETNRKAKAAAEKATKEAETAKLAEQQEWKKLADSYKADLDKLVPIAEQHEQITAAFNASLETRLKAIPEDIRKELVDPVRKGMNPVEFSEWLDKNGPRLQVKTAPPLDGGAGGTRTDSNPVFNLTQEEIDMANAGGLTLEVYAKRKAERDARKRNPSRE